MNMINVICVFKRICSEQFREIHGNHLEQSVRVGHVIPGPQKLGSHSHHPWTVRKYYYFVSFY